MPVVIRLTTADHGGTTMSCGTPGNDCGPDCGCGCPYTGMNERGAVEDVYAIESRSPGKWLALVIPPGEDEVFDAANRVTFNQVVHVYFNGSVVDYMAWADHA